MGFLSFWIRDGILRALLFIQKMFLLSLNPLFLSPFPLSLQERDDGIFMLVCP
jgi:hypothetical protein